MSIEMQPTGCWEKASSRHPKTRMAPPKRGHREKLYCKALCPTQNRRTKRWSQVTWGDISAFSPQAELLLYHEAGSPISSPYFRGLAPALDASDTLGG